MSNQKIENFLVKWATKVHGDYGTYSRQVATNRIRQVLSTKKIDHKYLFILSPPNGGSTMMHRLISSSQAVSINNHLGTREGQSLPTVKEHMKKRYHEDVPFDWKKIRKEWHKYWDLSLPVLLEKSPPNLVRAQAIQETFDPSYFIIMVRNPYAHCEVLMRRRGKSPEEAALFSINCLRLQYHNKQTLKNAVSISYELVTSKISQAKNMIADLLPELHDINIDQKYPYRGEKVLIKNLNDKGIGRLNREQIIALNTIFQKNEDLLNNLGYHLISTKCF